MNTLIAKQNKPVEFGTWLIEMLPYDKQTGLRVGQSYMNNVRPGKTCPEIFYEKDEDKVWPLIFKFEQANA